MKSPQKTFAAGVFGCVSHSTLTFYNVLDPEGWNLNIINSLLFVLLLSVFVVLIYRLHSRFIKVPLVIFILIISFIIWINPNINEQYKIYSWQMDLHISLSLFAYSLLSVATLYAISLWVHIWKLKNNHLGTNTHQLSIMEEEKKLFQLVILGWLILSVSLLSGAIFINDFFASKLGHKVTFSLLAWLVFGSIILGRLTKGWRGKKLITLIIIGMMLLAIGYLGSKIVIELLI